MLRGDDESAEAETLRQGLYEFNISTTPHKTACSVAFFLKGPDGRVRGGILGYGWGGWLHITYLWVSEALRGQGFGTRLLAAAEELAIKNGCRHSTLETFSFQARPFYERYGYQVAGQIDDYPEGYTHYIMKKSLTEDGQA